MSEPWKIDTGNVYFQKGILKSITKVENCGIGVFYSPDSKMYRACLIDGTEIDFRKQPQTNKAAIEMKGDTLVLQGIQDMYLTGAKNTTGNYSLAGCKGAVNVEENNCGGDSVFTSDRTFPDGLKQESELNILCNVMDKIRGSEGDESYYKGKYGNHHEIKNNISIWPNR